MGLRGALIVRALPPEGHPYSSRGYDPFWQAAAELRMPISLHVVTGGPAQASAEPTRQGDRGARKATRPESGWSRYYMFLTTDVQQSLFTILMGGVLERFPKLKMVSAENDTGWLPHFMYRLDHAYNKYGAHRAANSEMKPSEFMRRQLWATFQDDPIGPATYKFFGTDNYMWASDFPHTDSTWPNSLKVIKRTLPGSRRT